MEGRRGRDWAKLAALVLVAASLSVLHPTFLILVPLALLFLALPPRRPGLVALGGVIVVLAIAGALPGPLANVDRGWPFLLGGWFVLVLVLWPGEVFLGRGLAALAAAMASAAALLAASPEGWSRLDRAVSAQLDAAASEVAATVAAMASSRGSGGMGEQLSATVYRAADFQSAVFPALLGIASLAALAIAWWTYRRVACGDARPLGALREFRFDDHLVWLVVLGIVLFVAPLGDAAERAGANVLVFMGALYGVRGLAVVVSTIGPAPVAVAIGALGALLFPRLVAAAVLLVGLGDTWLDLRRRLRAADGPGWRGRG